MTDQPKRPTTKDTHQSARYIRIYKGGRSSDLLQRVQVIWCKGRLELIWEKRKAKFEDMGGWVQRDLDPSPDLRTLVALFICGLVPVGVFADRLQEEFPETEPLANTLREYERLAAEEKVEREEAVALFNSLPTSASLPDSTWEEIE